MADGTPLKTLQIEPAKKIDYTFYKPLLDTFAQLLRQSLGERVISLVLYGSVARGTATPESDIDLLIVLRDPPRAYHQRVQWIWNVQEELRETPIFKEYLRKGCDPYLSYIIFSKGEAQENRYLYLDMIEEAVILYDQGNFMRRKLADMKRRLKELGSRKIYCEDGSWYWILKPDLKWGEVFEL